nr:unnamed protein product [Spirometra erinaceieuropaei]
MDRRRTPFLPPRWLKCPRVGSMLLDLFIPCKTPLDSKFSQVIDQEDVFEPDNLFEYVKPACLGLIIDLTKSSRFYNRREIENRGCKYVKIACKGNEETPTLEQVKLFISLVNKFEENEAGEGKKIGVHCTHGFNRTGFLIAAYLVEERNFSLECALQLFAEARPPGIYKADYLKELFERYGDPDDCPAAPPLPDWCFEEGDHSNAPSLLKRRHQDSPRDDEADGDSKERRLSDSTPSSSSGGDVVGGPEVKLSHRERLNLPAPPGQPRLMSGVTGVRTLDQTSFEAHHVREVADVLLTLGAVAPKATTSTPVAVEDVDDVTTTSSNTESTTLEGINEQSLRSIPLFIPNIQRSRPPRFRGSQPVSMTRQNARLIVDRPYAVTYKSDGTRYLLLIHGPEKVYLIDRANFVYKVETLHFPSASWLHSALQARKEGRIVSDFLTEPSCHLVNCLLDGELVAFDTPDRPFKFLIYDALTIQGYPCGRMPFEHRLNYIEKYVVRPRNDAGHNGLVDFTTQSFSVRKKPFFRLDHVAELLQSTRQTLMHETDGLIFQPAGNADFYVPGTCPETLKWKPPELNTIDFRCKVYLRKAPGEISQYVGELFLGGSSVPNAHLAQVTSKEKSLDGKIVECLCDRTCGGWKVQRIRTDKVEPNHLSIGKSIMESILYPVTAEDVIALVNLWRQIGMQRQFEREERMKREQLLGGRPGGSKEHTA